MKFKFSLIQAWMLIILFAIFVPVTTAMIWYGATLYTHELKNALVIEQQKNEIIKNRIEAEIKRFKTLLNNKSDPLSFLIENTSKEKSIQQINQLLRVIVEREQTSLPYMIPASGSPVKTGFQQKKKTLHLNTGISTKQKICPKLLFPHSEGHISVLLVTTITRSHLKWPIQ